MKYRPEIDGLRALAVLPVFFYHLGIGLFGGGYVGVDIFFVISGYLITSIIWNDLQDGKFSFAKFYERRIRRIIPALYVVLFFSSLFAFLFFMDDEFQYFCKSMFATVLFYSNIQFWSEAGYFDLKSHMKPLLHTWSLAIEEQFYIFFPWVLMGLKKYAKMYVGYALAFLALLSFFCGLYVLQHDSNSAFYWMHLRAWELLLGCILALRLFPSAKRKYIFESLSLLGLLLIGYAIVYLHAGSKFPGLNALIPCLGTAAIIYTSDQGIQTAVSKMLSNSWLVQIGKISYSLYLWHWPLIVFAKYWTMKNLDPYQCGFVFAVGVSLAFLSWKYLEQPIRKKQGVFANLKPLLIGSAIVTAGLCIFGYAGAFVKNSFSFRLPEKVANYSRGTSDTNPMRKTCHGQGMWRAENDKLCELGRPNKEGKPQFIVWGDSHADALFPAFELMANNTQSYGLYASLSACTPLIGITKQGQKKCYEFNRLVLDLIRKHEIKNIVLVANWHLGGISIKNEQDGKIIGDVTEKPDEQDELETEIKSGKYTLEDAKIFKNALQSTVSAIEGIPANVWFLIRVPRAKFDVSSTLGRYERFHRTKSGLKISVEDYKNRLSDVKTILDELKMKHVIHLIDPFDAFCSNDTGTCMIEAEGKPLYRDEGHLTAFGARYVAPVLLADFFRSIQEQSFSSINN